ncbi:MAG: hypothetical protein ABIP39_01615 [Polyangiaceae bacterium]
MVAKAWGIEKSVRGSSSAVAAPAVEELFFTNAAVSLCLLVHRRAKTMRVVDFRAGATSAKRLFVLSFAHREGIEKVYTLVERDEVSTWTKLGFTKEGAVPGFYKRSDAYLLGCTVTGQPRNIPLESETRIAISPPTSRAAYERAESAPDPVEEDVVVDTTAHDFAEKTLVLAKKRAKELADDGPVKRGQAPRSVVPTAKVTRLKEADVKKPVAAALKSGRALTAFEPFGRDVVRSYYSVTARGGFELIASTESQECFGNAYLELLTGPKTEAERVGTAAALGALCERLIEDDIVSCFGLVPSDDVALATAYVFNGFRRTGLLQNHMVVGSERKDAIVFSRKLANPADD